MPDAREWQFVHLARFLDWTISPALDSRRRAASRVAEWHATGNALEGILWLELGGLVGYFPIEELSEILRGIVAELQLTSKDADNWRDLFSTTVMLMIEALGRGRGVRQSEPVIKFEQRDLVRSAFQTCLQFSVSFGRTKAAQALSAAVTIDNNQQWEGRMQTPLSQERVVAILTTGRTPESEADQTVLTAGFLQAIDHMAGYSELFENDFSPLRAGNRDDFFAFQRRVGQIQNWRFNFLQEQTERRFRTCASTVGELIFLDSSRASTFLENVDGIMSQWQNRGAEGLAFAFA